MIILGIDTSCDDTSVAVTRDRQVLSNVISSQDTLHAPWGGVVPHLARRAHEENFPHVYQQALQQAGVSENEIDLIAVTKGHGLAIALEVGITRAQELALRLQKPLYAIHHSEGHFLASFAQDASGAAPIDPERVVFPALAILVAGGQTQFVMVKSFGHYDVIGETVDDAIGEAFDKGARLLGFGYPGGAELAQAATQGNSQAYNLPRPMRGSGDLNVSYAGLKTALLRLVRSLETETAIGTISNKQRVDLAASFQQAAVETLVIKVRKALEQYGFEQVFMGGGVAANITLREQLDSLVIQNNSQLFVPYTTQLCRDNAAMIAVAGYFQSLREQPLTDPTQLDRDPQLKLPV
jgi:N6-L-threonylcarbamoyladenine synthase